MQIGRPDPAVTAICRAAAARRRAAGAAPVASDRGSLFPRH
jgi:hypothetical protein